MSNRWRHCTAPSPSLTYSGCLVINGDNLLPYPVPAIATRRKVTATFCQFSAKKENRLRAAGTMKNCRSSLSVISFTKMLFSCPLSQQGGIGQSSGLGGGVARTSGIGGGGIIRTTHTYTSSSQMPSCAAAEIQGKNCNTLQDFQSLLYSKATRTGSNKGLSHIAYRCYLKVLL